MPEYDAVVIGSGPNGLAAAISLLKAGLSIKIIEAKKTIGGGMRSAELTLPGFIHDICSAIHPLAAASPFFSSLPLKDFGLEWIYPPIPLVHPFDNGDAAVLYNSIHETAQLLEVDKESYERITPLVKNFNKLLPDILEPLSFPEHPFLFLKFGIKAIQPSVRFINGNFKTKRARALLMGLAAHAIVPLEKYLTNSFGLVLALAGHSLGWPLPRGGSQKIAEALEKYIIFLGGKIQTGSKVTSTDELPSASIYIFDLTPKQIIEITGKKLPEGYKRSLSRYRYGPGVFKIDYALSEPIPFKSKLCLETATIHLGNTAEEILHSENTVWDKRHPEKPYIILAQPTLFDTSRAPENKHTLWAYCHVPNGSTINMSEAIENQIERFAPGFRDIIIARSFMNSHDFQNYNYNYIGGDINGGIQDLRQLFFRPVVSFNPYKMPIKGMYICSSSTPPGGGVHGMCGYNAAKKVIKELF